MQPSLHVGEGEHDGVDLALADRDAQLLQAQQAAPVTASAMFQRHQTDSSRSIAASSSGVPWTLGPVNHFLAETSQ